MDFAVESERFQGVELLRLRAPGGATAVVVPAWGGNCIAFGTVDGPVLEAASLEEVARKPTAYGIPILFPFPNRIRDGRFTFEGREHRIDPPRHGLVRDKPWTIVVSGAAEADGAWLRMRLDASDHPREILGQFPFPFRIEATVRARCSAWHQEKRPAGPSTSRKKRGRESFSETHPAHLDSSLGRPTLRSVESRPRLKAISFLQISSP